MRSTLLRLALPAGLAALALGSATAAVAVPPTDQAARPGGTVPADFRGSSVDWLTPSAGFVLGTATCGAQACTDVLSSTDGGTSWSLIGTVPAPITTAGESDGAGVTDVRFETSSDGWAFGPKLFVTGDGGASWSRSTIPGHGKSVVSLDATAHGTYVVVSRCKYATGSCGHALSVWRTSAPGSQDWSRIHLEMPWSVAADVASYGKTVYLIDDQAGEGADDSHSSTDEFYASTDGTTFTTRPVPCNNAMGEALVQAVPTSRTNVALLCVANIGFGQAHKKVYRSTNDAKTVHSAGVTPTDGIQTQIAAAPSGAIAMASSSNGSFLYLNQGGKSWQTEEAWGDGGAGWNDIVFTSDSDAWVIYAPAGFFHGAGQLYASHDGGVTWALSPY